MLATPTSGKPAQSTMDDPVITSEDNALGLPYLFTRIFNLAGVPATSEPCGLACQGLPIGLQVGGYPGADDTVLKVAYAYEQSTPWYTMRPPNA